MQELKDDQFKKAWVNLTAGLGNNAPKQIKNSIFIIQNHIMQFQDPSIEEDPELQNAALDLKQLYVFIDEIESSIN